MGCEVQKTDTGVEIDVHRFDTYEAAKHYVEVSRVYAFDHMDSWGIDGNIYCYVGPNPGERAAIRRDGKGFRASFWIEAGAKPPAETVLAGMLKLLPSLSNPDLITLAEAASALNNERVEAGGEVFAVTRHKVLGTLSPAGKALARKHGNLG